MQPRFNLPDSHLDWNGVYDDMGGLREPWEDSVGHYSVCSHSQDWPRGIWDLRCATHSRHHYHPAHLISGSFNGHVSFSQREEAGAFSGTPRLWRWDNIDDPVVLERITDWNSDHRHIVLWRYSLIFPLFSDSYAIQMVLRAYLENCTENTLSNGTRTSRGKDALHSPSPPFLSHFSFCIIFNPLDLRM